MRKRNRGQILPIFLPVLFAMLWLGYSNFQIGFLSYRKIESQKKLDAFALSLAHEYARGYNGLAALNDGLAIVQRRVLMVSSIQAALVACSPGSLTCFHAAGRLAAQLPNFYAKAQKLSEHLAHQQQQIIDWMLKRGCDYEISGRQKFVRFEMFPSTCKGSAGDLPFSRPNSYSSSSVSPVKLYSPLELSPAFFKQESQSIFLSGSQVNSPVGKNNGLLWTLSQIQIRGKDFQEMEFTPSLAKISLQRQLWSSSNQLGLPDLRNFEHDINH